MKKIIIAILSCMVMAFTFVACESTCAHSFEEGVCTTCGYECEHSAYEEGICKTCGKECDHIYDGTEMGICSICGTACDHGEYKDGVCVACGETCDHPSYENGGCSVCDVICEHAEYVEGVCTTCQTPCEHNEYVNSECTTCGTVCNHPEFEEGDCTTCGYQDFTWVPADGGVSRYEDVVDKYKWISQQLTANGELPAIGEDDPYYVDALHNALSVALPEEEGDEINTDVELGYAFKDLNGDGWKEMIILQRDLYVYAVFTFVNREITVAYNNVEKYGYSYICADDTLFYQTKGYNTDDLEDEDRTQISLAYNIKKLTVDKFEGVEYGWYEVDDVRNYYQVVNGERKENTKDEYTKWGYIYSYHTGNPTLFAKKANLLITTVFGGTEVTPTETFDLSSSYEAIINTYKNMFNATGKKFDKTNWLDGMYDNGMLFNSKEDYDLYNRFLCAIVSLQYNATSSTYGYVEKDLNGDGVKELIIMDFYNASSPASKRYDIFAIFTLVDGKPVLLDMYSDLRIAAIDASGKIYVAEKQLRHSKDMNYYVYEIKDGKLAVVDAYGFYSNYASSSTAEKWYKIVDGNEVEITQAEYDELFNKYLIHKSATASNYGKWCYINSGLEMEATFGKGVA